MSDESWGPFSTAPKDGSIFEIECRWGVVPWRKLCQWGVDPFGKVTWVNPRAKPVKDSEGRVVLFEGGGVMPEAEYVTFWRPYKGSVAEHFDPLERMDAFDYHRGARPSWRAMRAARRNAQGKKPWWHFVTSRSPPQDVRRGEP